MFLHRVPKKAASLVLLVLAGSPLHASEDMDAEKRLAQFRTVVDEQCSDSYKQTREGVLQGAKDLEAFVQQDAELGLLTDQQLKEAYILQEKCLRYLAYGYTEHGTPENRLYVEKLQGVMEERVKLEPESLDLLFEYSWVLTDKEQQVKVWRRIIAKDPEFTPAQGALGFYLFQQGSTEEGIAKLRYAFERSTGDEAWNHGVNLIYALESLERHHEAEKVRVIVDALPRGGERAH